MPALVLGSTQHRSALVDEGRQAEAEGWEVAGRRSGGGLVVIDPEVTVWIDVLVPRDHPRWDDDIGRAFHWVGDVWADALRDSLRDALRHALPGAGAVAVHRGAAVDPEVGRVVCFAGLGHGEVTVADREGAPWKVVGLSQRRTRAGARIQGLAVLHHDPDVIRRHLAAPLPSGRRVDDLRIGVPGLDRPAAARLAPSLRRAVAAGLAAADNASIDNASIDNGSGDGRETDGGPRPG